MTDGLKPDNKDQYGKPLLIAKRSVGITMAIWAFLIIIGIALVMQFYSIKRGGGKIDEIAHAKSSLGIILLILGIIYVYCSSLFFRRYWIGRWLVIIVSFVYLCICVLLIYTFSFRLPVIKLLNIVSVMSIVVLLMMFHPAVVAWCYRIPLSQKKISSEHGYNRIPVIIANILVGIDMIMGTAMLFMIPSAISDSNRLTAYIIIVVIFNTLCPLLFFLYSKIGRYALIFVCGLSVFVDIYRITNKTKLLEFPPSVEEIINLLVLLMMFNPSVAAWSWRTRGVKKESPTDPQMLLQ